MEFFRLPLRLKNGMLARDESAIKAAGARLKLFLASQGNAYAGLCSNGALRLASYLNRLAPEKSLELLYQEGEEERNDMKDLCRQLVEELSAFLHGIAEVKKVAFHGNRIHCHVRLLVQSAQQALIYELRVSKTLNEWMIHEPTYRSDGDV